jgi:hypothetical protein
MNLFVFSVITAVSCCKYPAAGRLLLPACCSMLLLPLPLLPNKRGEHYGVRQLKWDDNDTKIPQKNCTYL